MKHSFSSLALAALWLLARCQESGVHGQEPAASGQQLVVEAARRLDGESAIAAELRYRVDAFGHQLLGTGSYLQSGAGTQRQLRLDLRMQVGDKPATLQEIRGADYYWIRRDVPPNLPTLGRVDLVQLRRALRRPDQPLADEVLPRGAWIMLGGLPRLLAALEQNFSFDQPRPDEVQFSSTTGQAARLPIWVLEGHWKPARLAALTGDNSIRSTSDIGNTPEQLPDRVEVVLDRSDKSLPLFPYRVSYWRSPQTKKPGVSTEMAARELLALELFNVRRVGPIDAREFQYTPGDQEVLDHTAAYIQQFSGGKKLR